MARLFEKIFGASAQRGRTLPLSVQRRIVCDLLHFAKKIPTVPVQKTIDVSQLMKLRGLAKLRIGWCTLFTKAYALASESMPELRRAYIEYPWPRLYEHPFSAVSVAIERKYQGEDGVFFAHVSQPEKMSLVELEAAIQRYKDEPVDQVFAFLLGAYRFPRFLRRMMMWYLLNLRGDRKAVYLGTFGVTVYSSLGAESLHPLSPVTTTMNYGVIGKDGQVPVRVVYDHRVMDGATIARALNRLEVVLNTVIARELEELISKESGDRSGKSENGIVDHRLPIHESPLPTTAEESNR